MTYADYTASGRALDKLVGVLGLRSPSRLDARYHRDDTIAAEQRPVVFIGTATGTSTLPRSSGNCWGYAARPLRIAASPWRLVLLGLRRGRPYVDIGMCAVPERDPLSSKDAVFLSPHKLIGGTVDYVDPSEHRDLDDPAQREGLPAARRQHVAEGAAHRDPGQPRCVDRAGSGRVRAPAPWWSRTCR